jgi:hypothetical protein
MPLCSLLAEVESSAMITEQHVGSSITSLLQLTLELCQASPLMTTANNFYCTQRSIEQFLRELP